MNNACANNKDMSEQNDKNTNSSFKCEVCNFRCALCFKLKNHELFHHAKSCPFCNDDRFSSIRDHLNNLHSHIIQEDGDVNFKAFSDITNKSNVHTEIRSSSETENEVSNNYKKIRETVVFKEDKNLMNSKQVSHKSNLILKLHDTKQIVTLVDCLFCSFADEDGNVVEEHVNKEHLDIISPNISVRTRTLDITYPCPICNNVFNTENEIEVHVNMVHKDVISPQKDNEELLKEHNISHLCPVCKIIVCDSTEKLDTHLKTHYNETDISQLSPTTSSDDFLAKELRKEYKETLKQTEKKELEYLQVQYGMDNDGNFKEQSIVNMQRAVYKGELSASEFYEKEVELKYAENIGIDDGNSCISGVIPYIMNKSMNSRNVDKTYLCSDVDYYLSTYGDKGWGCGYRNLQMLLSSLMRYNIYYEQLKQLWKRSGKEEIPHARTAMPSIPQLQRGIEWAWSEGFDEQGCEQFNGHVYDTRRWIGATEVKMLLSSIKIRCELLDFHKLPESKFHSVLSDWIISYFNKEEVLYPLYLQHQGHSRTVVGIEQLKNGKHLFLILDPIYTRKEMCSIMTTPNSDKPMGKIRKTNWNLKNIQYQIVVVTGVIKSDLEYQANKIINSTKMC